MTINVAPIAQTLFTESDVTVPFIKWKCNEGTGDILGAQSNLTIPDLPITQDGSAIWTAEGNAIAIDIATPGSEYIHQTALDSILAAMGGMAGSGTYILAFRRKAGSFPSAGNESLISYGTDAASATGRWTLRETVSLLDLHIRDVNNNTATLISRGLAIAPTLNDEEYHTSIFVVNLINDSVSFYYDGGTAPIGTTPTITSVVPLADLPTSSVGATTQWGIFCRPDSGTPTAFIGANGNRTNNIYGVHDIMIVRSASDLDPYIAAFSKQYHNYDRELPPILNEMPA